MRATRRHWRCSPLRTDTTADIGVDTNNIDEDVSLKNKGTNFNSHITSSYNINKIPKISMKGDLIYLVYRWCVLLYNITDVMSYLKRLNSVIVCFLEVRLRNADGSVWARIVWCTCQSEHKGGHITWDNRKRNKQEHGPAGGQTGVTSKRVLCARAYIWYIIHKHTHVDLYWMFCDFVSADIRTPSSSWRSLVTLRLVTLRLVTLRLVTWRLEQKTRNVWQPCANMDRLSSQGHTATVTLQERVQRQPSQPIRQPWILHICLPLCIVKGDCTKQCHRLCI